MCRVELHAVQNKFLIRARAGSWGWGFGVWGCGGLMGWRQSCQREFTTCEIFLKMVMEMITGKSEKSALELVVEVPAVRNPFINTEITFKFVKLPIYFVMVCPMSFNGLWEQREASYCM